MPKEALIERIAEQQGRPNLAEILVLHTRVVDERLLRMLTAGLVQTMELDISSTEDDRYYIGHHWQFYENRGLVFPPPNVSLEEAMWAIISYRVFTKLDCKDKGAVPKVAELALSLGSSNCMLHAFVREFDYQKNGREGHWLYENIGLEEIIRLRNEVGQPALQVSCRGFTYNGIATTDDYQVSNLNEVCTKAKENKIEVVNLNLPDNQVPPDWALKYFYDNGVLLEVYEDSRKRQLSCDVFTTIEVE